MCENLGAFKTSEVFAHSMTPKHVTLRYESHMGHILFMIFNLTENEEKRLLGMIHMMWRRGLWIILSGGRVWDALEKGLM